MKHWEQKIKDVSPDVSEELKKLYDVYITVLDTSIPPWTEQKEGILLYDIDVSQSETQNEQDNALNSASTENKQDNALNSASTENKKENIETK